MLLTGPSHFRFRNKVRRDQEDPADRRHVQARSFITYASYSSQIWHYVFNRSKCNAATGIPEKLEYENLDLFLQVLRMSEKAVGKQLTIWKARVFNIRTSWRLCFTYMRKRQTSIALSAESRSDPITGCTRISRSSTTIRRLWHNICQ